MIQIYKKASNLLCMRLPFILDNTPNYLDGCVIQKRWGLSSKTLTSFICSLVIGFIKTLRNIEPKGFRFLFFFIRSSLQASCRCNSKFSALKKIHIKYFDFKVLIRKTSMQKFFPQMLILGSAYNPFILPQIDLFISIL